MRFCFYSVFVFLITIVYSLPSTCFADTIITDTSIDDVQTWGLAGSPYTIPNVSGGDVTIAETGILNIEAGVTVYASPGRKFEVRGTLNILGTEVSPVTLTNVGDSVPANSSRSG